MIELTDGVANDAALHRLIAAGVFGSDADGKRVQPASVDVALSGEAYEMPASFLPGGRRVPDIIRRQGGLPLRGDATGAFQLDVDRIYLFRLKERLSLPADAHARFNAKSSTGRLDVFARVVADTGHYFDLVPAGYEGDLWLEVVPRSFPVIVRPGTRLAQMRVFSGGTLALADADLATRPEFAADILRDGLEVQVDLRADETGIAGWIAKTVEVEPIDVDRCAALRAEDYFDPVVVDDDALVLVPSRFYILRSARNVIVPVDLSAEMISADTNAGEFRVHYAGFFDPGFGTGDAASRAVLEVRARDVPFTMVTNQNVGRLVYHRMSEEPLSPYGSDIGSNYQGQGLRLSKHFRPTRYQSMADPAPTQEVQP